MDGEANAACGARRRVACRRRVHRFVEARRAELRSRSASYVPALII
jgi:hypothetical protein